MGFIEPDAYACLCDRCGERRKFQGKSETRFTDPPHHVAGWRTVYADLMSKAPSYNANDWREDRVDEQLLCPDCFRHLVVVWRNFVGWFDDAWEEEGED